MTIDHFALFFLNSLSTEYIILRCIGRMAFPIFAFLSVEALYHSRNVIRYVSVLIYLGIVIDICLYFSSKNTMGNTFIDLGLSILACYFLRKRNLYSLFAIIPIAYLISTDFCYYTYSDYGTFGLLLVLMIFASYEIAEQYEISLYKKTNIDLGVIKSTYDRKMKNYFSSISIVLIYLLFYSLYRMGVDIPIIPEAIIIQQYGIFSIIFIILYNGKRGYKNSILKYSFYAYYPLHVLIMLLISKLIA